MAKRLRRVFTETFKAEALRLAQASDGNVAAVARSLDTARVRALLGPIYTLRIGEVTERKALALYERAIKEPSKKTGPPLRPATHRFYLYLAQSLWAWAHK